MGAQMAMRIMRVNQSSPATGILLRGDIINSINGTPVTDSYSFANLLAAAPENENLVLSIKRGQQFQVVQLPLPESRTLGLQVAFAGDDSENQVVRRGAQSGTIDIEISRAIMRVQGSASGLKYSSMVLLIIVLIACLFLIIQGYQGTCPGLDEFCSAREKVTDSGLINFAFTTAFVWILVTRVVWALANGLQLAAAVAKKQV